MKISVERYGPFVNRGLQVMLLKSNKAAVDLNANAATPNRRIFIEAINKVYNLICRAKTSLSFARVQKLDGNKKAFFKKTNHLLHKLLRTPLPPHDLPVILAKETDYFPEKVKRMRREL